MLTIIAFIRLALVQIGLEEMVGAIDKVFAFIPTLLVVLLILLGGGILQNYLGKAATVAARGMGLDHPTGFGRVASALVIVLVAILALTQFGIETGLIENIIVVLLACLGLGAAISFGFGTRDYTKEIVAGLYTRRIVEIGEKIEVEGRSGTLMAISPITTLLKDSNGLFSVQNSIVLYNLNVPDATAAKEHE
ncbi:mechanosensitive ion channel [bacterium]|nr:mechanosensitive ion channel [bacterium]